jgi:hypothetical protein
VSIMAVVANWCDSLWMLIGVLEATGIAHPSVVVTASTTGLEKPEGAVGGDG